jgi:NADP-dependent 3-hydroxy acid dehydrogenase YdfG
MTRADDRVAVITGAGGAIGSALAQACVIDAFRVLPVYRRPGGETGAAALFGDLGSATDVEALCERLGALERLSLLVHAAGDYDRGSIEASPVRLLERLYQVNVAAAYALTRAALPALRRAGGTVVFLNSSVVDQPRPAHVTPYAMTKAALRALADGLRAEENRHGVGVLSVYPGRTAGALQERLHQHEARRYAAEDLLQPADVARAVLDAVALPSTAEVTDLHLRPRRPPG